MRLGKRKGKASAGRMDYVKGIGSWCFRPGVRLRCVRACRVRARRREVADSARHEGRRAGIEKEVDLSAGRAEILELFSGRDWLALLGHYGVRHAGENADEGLGIDEKRSRVFLLLISRRAGGSAGCQSESKGDDGENKLSRLRAGRAFSDFAGYAGHRAIASTYNPT